MLLFPVNNVVVRILWKKIITNKKKGTKAPSKTKQSTFLSYNLFKLNRSQCKSTYKKANIKGNYNYNSLSLYICKLILRKYFVKQAR